MTNPSIIGLGPGLYELPLFATIGYRTVLLGKYVSGIPV